MIKTILQERTAKSMDDLKHSNDCW